MSGTHGAAIDTGPPVSVEKGFYGRDDVLRFVQDELSSPHRKVIILYGQRRIGKTSILHRLLSGASSEFYSVCFDLEGQARRSLAEILYDLMREIAASLALSVPKRESFTLGYFKTGFLPRVYEALDKRSKDQRLLLLFDEFDVLEDESQTGDGAGSFFPYFQQLLGEPRLAFVFAGGRRMEDLSTRFHSFSKVAIFRWISFLRDVDTVQLITEPARETLEYTESAIERIKSLTSGHPYLTQLICEEIFHQYASPSQKVRVTADDIDDNVINEALKRGAGGLGWWKKHLHPSAIAVLLIVAYAVQKQKEINYDGILETLQDERILLGAEELRPALKDLVDWEYLKRDQDIYKFTVELQRLWIIKNYSIEDARDALETTTSLILRKAAEAYRAEEYVTAIDCYKQILGSKPDHPEARLKLAQTLRAQGKLEEAVEEYKRALKVAKDKVSVSDQLIATWLAFARSLEVDRKLMQAIEEYVDLLEDFPKETEPRQRLREGLPQLLAEQKKLEEGLGKYIGLFQGGKQSASEGLLETGRIFAESFAEKNPQRTAEEYSRLRGILPQEVELRRPWADAKLKYADSLYESKRYDEARRVYGEVWKDLESEIWLAEIRRWAEVGQRKSEAKIYESNRDFANAASSYAELEKLEPDKKEWQDKHKEMADQVTKGEIWARIVDARSKESWSDVVKNCKELLDKLEDPKYDKDLNIHLLLAEAYSRLAEKRGLHISAFQCLTMKDGTILVGQFDKETDSSSHLLTMPQSALLFRSIGIAVAFLVLGIVIGFVLRLLLMPISILFILIVLSLLFMRVLVPFIRRTQNKIVSQGPLVPYSSFLGASKKTEAEPVQPFWDAIKRLFRINKRTSQRNANSGPTAK